MSRLWLLGKLKEEVAELETALVSGGPDDVRSECADVGNFAMMLADVGGGMQPDPSHERIAAVIRAAVDATAKRRGIDAVKAVTRQGGGGVPEYTHARGVMEHAVAALTPEDLARFGIGGKE
jgi:NTP pyrophosphatase (non-canonical NTP hydrolase)